MVLKFWKLVSFSCQDCQLRKPKVTVVEKPKFDFSFIPANMPFTSPTLTFYNGVKCPVIGLGTWKSEPGQVTDAVKYAIDIGYRHIDCAFVYGNEKEVGDAVKAKIDEGVVKREEMFITSKLWNTYHRTDLVLGALKKSLELLQLDYLDLYLIHWPMAYKEGPDLFPRDSDGLMMYSDASYLDTWKELEKAVQAGLVKSIGLSNFNSKQVDDILKIATIKPVTNQVECHPYFNQKKLQKFCEARGIYLTAYSPLGSPDRPWASTYDAILLEDETVKAVGEKHGKNAAQILIRYQVQRGNIVIPKSVNPTRIASNADVFDFELSAEDVAALDGLHKGDRYVHLTWCAKHKDYPFAIDF